jgi:hypothetical protein
MFSFFCRFKIVNSAKYLRSPNPEIKSTFDGELESVLILSDIHLTQPEKFAQGLP